VLVTEHFGATEPIWRPLEIHVHVMERHRQVIECRDPNARRRWVLHRHRDVVSIDGIEHHREQSMPSTVTVLPFPDQLLLRRVLEDPDTGTRIALYGDPNAPLNKRTRVRVGQRGRPTEWHEARVTGVSADERYVHTLLGTLDLQADLWRERFMEALPLSAHGLPEEDEWGAPLTRTLTPDSTRALLVLCALILGLVLGVALGYAI
jgi:hypothetical protein